MNKKEITVTIVDSHWSALAPRIDYSGPPELRSLFAFAHNSEIVEIEACPGCWEAQTWHKISDKTLWAEAKAPVRTITFYNVTGK